MKTHPDIQKLFEKYLAGTISKKEYENLLDHFSLDGNLKDIHDLILKAMEKEQDTSDFNGLEQTLRQTDSHIYQIARINKPRKPLIKRIFPYASVAALLIFGIFSYIYFIVSPKDTKNTISAIEKEDILPGKYTAILSLSSGETYHLSDNKNGIRTDDKGIHYAGGEKITDIKNTETVQVTVPRGGQYSLSLPDGTRVILNSESSLSYPVRFDGTTREVTMKGEAYFEVAHNPKLPFIVKAQQQSIKVLGTKFNLYSYQAESVVTTLLEGKVEVNAEGTNRRRILTPGEQSSVNGSRITKRKVDPLDYIGWTSDVFIFSDLKLTEIMRQISRWYDIEVIYPAGFKDQSFFAEIPRDRKLSEVLRALEHSGNFTFEIRGRRVMVKQ